MNPETLRILSLIFTFIVTFIISYLFMTLIVEMFDDNKKRKRKGEATTIYNRKKREFDYHNNPCGWRKWKYMNVEICDLVEGGTYY